MFIKIYNYFVVQHTSYFQRKSIHESSRNISIHSAFFVGSSIGDLSQSQNSKAKKRKLSFIPQSEIKIISQYLSKVAEIDEQLVFPFILCLTFGRI